MVLERVRARYADRQEEPMPVESPGVGSPLVDPAVRTPRSGELS
jgi:hypothetical protein